MSALDIFNNNAFSTFELTDAINVVPNKFGRLQELNLFPARPVRGRTIAIESKQGVLNLLPTKPVGSPGTLGTIDHRSLRDFTIPHIPHDDFLLAADVQSVRAFGSENQLMGVQDLLNDKLMTMRSKHSQTLEFLRWGALKGIILDADGSTLLNLFTEFGVSQETQDFDLDNTSAEVLLKTSALKRYMELNAFGAFVTGVHVFCSSGFFGALITHPKVEAAYSSYSVNNQNLANDYRNRFVHNGIVFEEHNGTATDAAGTVRKFIADDEAIAVPLGSDIFATYFAPADFIETVNTPGLEVYAKQERMDFDRGIKIHTQSNPLPMCNRPQLLVKLTRT